MESAEVNTETNPRLRSMLAATTLAASLAINSFAGGVAEADSVDSTSNRMLSEATSSTDLAQCPPVDSASIHVVKKMLNHPHNFDAPISHIPHKHTTASELQAKREVAAKKLHLTIHNYQSKYRSLFKDARTGNQISLNTYLQRDNEFAQPYGFTVTAPTTMPENNYAEPISPLDLNNLSVGEQKYARRSLTKLIDNMGALPVEIVKSIGLKHIYLVRIGKVATTGFADQVHGDAYYIDPTKRVDPHIFSHELFHLWDGQACGGPSGSFLDAQFDALNPTNVYSSYPYDQTRQTNRGDYTDLNTVVGSSEAQALARKLHRDEARNHTALARQDWNRYEALFNHVVAMNPPGLANLAEDKAYIGQEIFYPYNYHAIYDKKGQPILASKFAELLARIYQSHPKFAKYFIQVGNNKF